MRRLQILFVVLILCLFAAPVLAFQVEPSAPADMSWQYFVALLLNSFLIVAAVRLLTWAKPTIREQAGWALPPIAIVIGPLMATATAAVSTALGYPVDFSPIAGVFSGAAAVGGHQLFKQRQKQKAPKKAA